MDLLTIFPAAAASQARELQDAQSKGGSTNARLLSLPVLAGRRPYREGKIRNNAIMPNRTSAMTSE